MEHQFSKKSDLCCVALQVEERKFWVCPHQLATHSHVFRDMFFQVKCFSPRGFMISDAEKSANFGFSQIIEIEDTRADDFCTFLRMMTEIRFVDDDDLLTKDNYAGVLHLAERFHVQPIERGVEKFLTRKLKQQSQSFSAEKKFGEKEDIFKLMVWANEKRMENIISAGAACLENLSFNTIRSYRTIFDEKMLRRIIMKGVLANTSFLGRYYYFTEVDINASFERLVFLTEMELVDWPDKEEDKIFFYSVKAASASSVQKICSYSSKIDNRILLRMLEQKSTDARDWDDAEAEEILKFWGKFSLEEGRNENIIEKVLKVNRRVPLNLIRKCQDTLGAEMYIKLVNAKLDLCKAQLESKFLAHRLDPACVKSYLSYRCVGDGSGDGCFNKVIGKCKTCEQKFCEDCKNITFCHRQDQGIGLCGKCGKMKNPFESGTCFCDL